MAHVVNARGWASERGAEVIEFAIVLPVMLLIVFGIVDFGFLFQKYVVLTNAAMEGARVAVLPGYLNTDAEARSIAYTVDGGIPGTPTCPPAAGSGACAVAQPTTVPGVGGGTWPAWQVTVTYVHEYSYVGPIMQLFGSGLTTTTLTARATMRSQVGAAPGGS